MPFSFSIYLSCPIGHVDSDREDRFPLLTPKGMAVEQVPPSKWANIFNYATEGGEKYYCTVLSSSSPGGNVWLLAAEIFMSDEEKKVGVTRRSSQIARQVSSGIPRRAL